jgi:hypothetical protein
VSGKLCGGGGGTRDDFWELLGDGANRSNERGRANLPAIKQRNATLDSAVR